MLTAFLPLFAWRYPCPFMGFTSKGSEYAVNSTYWWFDVLTITCPQAKTRAFALNCRFCEYHREDLPLASGRSVAGYGSAQSLNLRLSPLAALSLTWTRNRTGVCFTTVEELVRICLRRGVLIGSCGNRAPKPSALIKYWNHWDGVFWARGILWKMTCLAAGKSIQ